MTDKNYSEKVAKLHDFSAKYISLPCLVISAMVTSFAIVNNSSATFIYATIAIFNFFSYCINIHIRDAHLATLDGIKEYERKQRIKDLNPNKE